MGLAAALTLTASSYQPRFKQFHPISRIGFGLITSYFAVRVLSQGSSTSACERNWSSFSHIHSKRRNRFLSGKLGDLVYVHSNLQLALSNVVKDESNSSNPLFEPVPNALGDQDDLGNEIDESNGDCDYSAFTPLSYLDDLEVFDVTNIQVGQENKNKTCDLVLDF